MEKITQETQELKNSELGIISFTLSIFADIFLGLIIMTGQVGMFRGLYFLCALSSTVVAIIDLNRSNRKKKLTKWALGLSSGILLALIIFVILFTVVKEMR